LCIGLDVGASLAAYGKQILSEVGYTNFHLLEILLAKDESRLVADYPDFNQATIDLLQHLRKYVVGRINA
jgi:hypothetical protein